MAAPPPAPVLARECGGCNVCCVALTIDDPALHKVQGVRCPNARPDNGCGIYDTRPGTCRRFLCGWMRHRWVRPGLRPDLSGVLVRGQVRDVDGVRRASIVVSLLREAGLEAEGLAETVAAPVASGMPVFLEVVSRPGYTYGTARVDGVLGDAVRARDKGALLGQLRAYWAQGRAQAVLSTPVPAVRPF